MATGEGRPGRRGALTGAHKAGPSRPAVDMTAEAEVMETPSAARAAAARTGQRAIAGSRAGPAEAAVEAADAVEAAVEAADAVEAEAAVAAVAAAAGRMAGAGPCIPYRNNIRREER